MFVFVCVFVYVNICCVCLSVCLSVKEGQREREGPVCSAVVCVLLGVFSVSFVSCLEAREERALLHANLKNLRRELLLLALRVCVCVRVCALQLELLLLPRGLL